MLRVTSLIAVLAVIASTSYAADTAHRGPEAGGRTYAQNYKDMVLATCLAQAYEGTQAGQDLGSSVAALRDWTYFDMDKSTEPREALVKEYLDRDYANPLAESEVKGVRFDFLKCLDLYHSPELQKQVDAYVAEPDNTYRKSNQ